jgi:dihydrofolate synthase / folylpolyglutamate synthase
MFQTIREATEWIGKWDTFSIKLGTERMDWMLEKLGHPERHCRVIHVAGTNGKGSTVSFISSILREAGYSVGTFTSPALETFNDRIRVNGEVISNDALLKAVNMVYEHAESLKDSEWGAPTEFEVITTLSLVYFAKIAYCDFTIMEVGLGGRYDSTNVVMPLIGVITNVGMDHVKQLGPTIRDIATEKAGIIKSGMPIVTGAKGDALDVVIKTATEKKAKLYVLGKEFLAENIHPESDGERFTLTTPFKKYEHLKISMFGTHQIENASAALMVIDYLRTYFAINVDEENVYKGLRQADWPGRFEMISKDPLVIVDGAHNIDGMTALVHTMKQHYQNRNTKVLFASLVDKDNSSILKKLSELASPVILTSFEHYRAIDAESLSNFVPSGMEWGIETDWIAAYQMLKESMKKDDILLITGSLYFIAEVRKFVKG